MTQGIGLFTQLTKYPTVVSLSFLPFDALFCCPQPGFAGEPGLFGQIIYLVGPNLLLDPVEALLE